MLHGESYGTFNTSSYVYFLRLRSKQSTPVKIESSKSKLYFFLFASPMHVLHGKTSQHGLQKLCLFFFNKNSKKWSPNLYLVLSASFPALFETEDVP